ncbi:Acyl-CoA:1-acyl-sn-glycerol-3-phosphate acyltransferase [hydrothermal vent metagenome]|uniref:Acyl-CoA:1-acyl-sn-glycerol-3-phosphate acyltransferase n=1 Tax=hydrothermal vent metagenome TaxID=652676 RepID=A0A3B1DKT8_9ZZZZ
MNQESVSSKVSPSSRNFYWHFFQWLLQQCFVFFICYRSRGVKNIPQTGGGLVLVNHQSFLDPLLVGAPLARPVSYLARDSLFRVPVVGFILRKTYVYPISRSAASPSTIKNAIRRMQQGYMVGIFPEGTRTQDGSVGEIKPGFISLVRRSKLPVYPVGIAGAFEVFPRDRKFPRPGKVRVVFGDPLTWEELLPFTKKGKEAELVELIRNRIIQCQQEAVDWRNGTIS